MKTKRMNLRLSKSLVLTVMMLLSATTTWAVDSYNIWIANTRVTNENKTDLSVIDGVTGTVTYDYSTRTLTLTDATISYAYTSGQKEGAVYIGSNHLEAIEVNGNCSITCTGEGGYGLVDNSTKKVTLKGDGKLTVRGPSAVYLQNLNSHLIVDGPTLVANGTASGAYGIGGSDNYGILTVNSGSVQATGTTGGSSIGNLGELNLGEDMYIAEPVGAKFYNHKVTTSDGANIISTVRIAHMLTCPLTLEAIADGTVTIDNPNGLTIGYKLNNGSITWKSDATISVTLYKGQQLAFYGDNATYATGGVNYTNIQCSADCYIYGNVMSLISSTNYSTLKELTEEDTFASLFYDNTHIKSHATKQVLLPATTLTGWCYTYMFSGCNGLTVVPALPATTLAKRCYGNFISRCDGLTTAPELPATTLAEGCYEQMFYACDNLTTAPVLPADKLVKECYDNMFASCDKLNYVKCLATDISAEKCTDGWLSYVSETGTFEKAAGFTGWTTGENGIPEGWTVTEDATKLPCGLAFSATELNVTYGDEVIEPTLENPHSLPVTYTSSKPSVATVDANGKLTILTEGTTVITASFAGNAEYYGGMVSYTLTVTSKGEVPELAFDREAMAVSKGKAFTAPKLTIPDGLTATYSSSNNSVVAVNATTGALTINGVGTATITVTTPATLQYASGSAVYYIMVLKNAEKFRCDANNDGSVSITDAVTVVNQILSGEAAAAPASDMPQEQEPMVDPE